MNAFTPRRLFAYAAEHLRLKQYLRNPGDGRIAPQIPATTLVKAFLLCTLLRQARFYSMDRLVKIFGPRKLGLSCGFSHDTLAYFTERMNVDQTRAALIDVLRHAKRSKAFDTSWFIGLAVDGTTCGQSAERCCPLCRPWTNEKGEVLGYHHAYVFISVVGVGITLPFDVEPYGPKDSEYAAGQRLLRRVLPTLGRRFADYLVVDGKFATAPFLQVADEVKIPVVARLKENIPTLLASVKKRFDRCASRLTIEHKNHRVELWDHDTFEPWDTCPWNSVRVIRYIQHTKPAPVVAEWITNIPTKTAGTASVFKMAKSRWEIENQGFNEAKTLYGLERIRHHDPNSMIAVLLLTILAIVIERLYRLRFLHRGSHPIKAAADACIMMWCALSVAFSDSG